MSFFKLQKNTLTPVLRRLARQLSPAQQQGFVLSWARKVAVEAQQTARGKGGRSFWTEVARSVNVRRAGLAGAEVYSDHVAAAQKQYGGKIRADQWPFLNIPIHPRSRGRSAREFVQAGVPMFALMSSPESGILATTGGSGQVVPLFARVRETADQRKDPFFPDDDEVLAIGTEMADKRLDRK